MIRFVKSQKKWSYPLKLFFQAYDVELLGFDPSTIEHCESRGTLSLNFSHNKRIRRECKDGVCIA